MEAHSAFHLTLQPLGRPTFGVWPLRRIETAAAAGIVGGLALAAPLLVYGWVRSAHSALELLMAPTAWLFGLGHFEANGYAWRSIFVGLVVYAAAAALAGMAFGAVADRVVGVETPIGVAALGIAWSVATYLTLFSMVLPIARDGAPFRATAATVGVAPAWVWVLGFVLLGVTTSFAYVLRRHD